MSNIGRQWDIDTENIDDYYCKDDVDNLQDSINIFPDFLKGLMTFREFTFNEINEYQNLINDLIENKNPIRRDKIENKIIKLFLDVYIDYETGESFSTNNYDLFKGAQVFNAILVLLREINTRTIGITEKIQKQLMGSDKTSNNTAKYRIGEYIDVWKIELKENPPMFNIFILSLTLKIPVENLINQPYSIIYSYFAALSIKQDLIDKEMKK